jgi:hypothetical protein
VVILQNYRWVRLEELASKFPQKILFESRRKKLQRFLSLPQLTVEKIWWPLLASYTIVILGDREFGGVDLARWLQSQPQTYFCLRLKRNEYVEIADDIWQLQDLGVTPGISLYLEGVKLTKNKGFSPANIVGKWKGKYRGWTVEEAWFILTNLADLELALSAYQKRFGIEEMFYPIINEVEEPKS